MLCWKECVTGLVQTSAEGQTALSCGSRVVLVLGPLISCLCLAVQVAAIKYPTKCEVHTFIWFYGLAAFSSSYLFWKKSEHRILLLFVADITVTLLPLLPAQRAIKGPFQTALVYVTSSILKIWFWFLDVVVIFVIIEIQEAKLIMLA